MEKYILELISENNRVIIPNFGAFIVSKEHGTSILFNNFLSFNDGLLVNYIAEQKEIDTIVATDQVFEYVDRLKKELDESGIYLIDKLGTFKKDDNGILRFQQADEFAEQFSEESKKDTNTTTNNDIKKETDDSSKKVFLLDVEEEEKPKTPPVTTEKPKEEKTPVIEPKETEKKEVSEKRIIIPPVTKPVTNTTDKKEKVQLKKPTPRKEVIRKKDNKGGVIFIVITAIIIIALGIYFLFFHKNSEPEIKTPKKAIVKQAIKKPVVKDTIKVLPKAPKPVEKPKSLKPEAEKGIFYIIVGGFSEVNNAHKMVEQLKGKGYSNAQMIVKGKMNLVSIDSNSSYTKVEAKQQEILSEKIESWLYKAK